MGAVQNGTFLWAMRSFSKTIPPAYSYYYLGLKFGHYKCYIDDIIQEIIATWLSFNQTRHSAMPYIDDRN